jgi:hypothetical protein
MMDALILAMTERLSDALAALVIDVFMLAMTEILFDALAALTVDVEAAQIAAHASAPEADSEVVRSTFVVAAAVVTVNHAEKADGVVPSVSNTLNS